MSKKTLLSLALFVVVCGLSGTGWAAVPGLVGWWSFDEGAGDVAGDGSGNGNHGQIVNATWTEGQLGSALNFDGTAYVEIPPVAWHGIDQQATLAFWVYGDPAAQPQANFIVAAFVDPPDNQTRAFSAHIPWSNSNVYFDTGGTTAGGYDRIQNAATPDIFAGSWQHWALVKDAGTGDQSIYLNGALWFSGTGLTRAIGGADVTGFTVGSKASHENFFFGMIDDVQLYDVALTEGEILVAMEGITTVQAGALAPEDGAVDVPRDTVLSWSPGEFAATHNVYLGNAFEDVNTADPAVQVGDGLGTTSLDLDRLDFNQTYYWRVDEVNGAPDFTVYNGEVWSFEVEPFSIPISDVTVTASSTFGASGPEKTLDGSGLVDDLHGVSAVDMWISGGVPATIEYAFDRVYKLHELWIWNSNQLIEAFVGFGAKDVVIEHSLDGENWTVLEGVGPLAQAPGIDTYAANNMIDFGGATAQHVRISINSVQGIAPQASLSEVRFYYVPTLATRPTPASGATDVAPDVSLSWGRNGREAGSHKVFVGSDPENLSSAGSVNESSLDTLALDLQLGQNYSWRVDEVNETMDPSIWEGTVWSFTTTDTITIDDMESYKDEEFFEIWATWVDGFDDPANGSLVGNGAGGTPETGIVHGGGQSLPMGYDNSAALSEATHTFDAPMDWTRHGIKTLALAFHGAAGNTGTLYVKINNTKLVYDQDPTDIASGVWLAWNIDLTGMGGLQNVTSLTIGVDGASGAGILYIDDILLSPEVGEFLTPAEPDAANLAGHWTFDENTGEVAGDVSGNGNDGTIFNGSWQAGKLGSALSFTGTTHVEIPARAWVSVDTQVTIAFWNFAETTPSNNFIFGAFIDPDVGQSRVGSAHVPWGGQIYFDTSGDAASTYNRINKGVQDSEYLGAWHHWAFVKNADTGRQEIYLDGILWLGVDGMTKPMDGAGVTVFHIGASPTLANYYNGLVDDFQLHNRALSPEELIWLAGRRDPIHKPL